ncbi:MAG: AAA family ATPase [Prevotellaceae bacterium]|jgi:exodeoxyribonuclease-5|nr:AAA family ATPase [Prevotellaceae bacterium]
MLERHILSLLLNRLGFEPTRGQLTLFKELAEYIVNFTDSRIFLISGYAGTGKTSAIGSLVGVLKSMKQNVILLAPTGRAAKVLSSYACAPAYTIHKKIYRQKSLSDEMSLFTLDRNLHKDTLFIVDEASMVVNTPSSSAVFGSGMLLDDLVNYVRSGVRCRLILVGDSAQLPPIGFSVSPALDSSTLTIYGECIRTELTDVVRQATDSGILTNATLIRRNIENGVARLPDFKLSGFPDIIQINGSDVQETLDQAYSQYGEDNVIVVCRSNIRANNYNNGVRTSIFGRDEELVSGDRLMVVKNHYGSFDTMEEPIGFIANGDIAEVVRIRKYEERYGYRFVDVLLRLPDYNDIKIESKLLLDTLTLETPSLSADSSRELFFSVNEDYSHITLKRKRYKAVREDLYFNALQVKYAYALTCHKAQGGQWKVVILDQLFFKDELRLEDLRWLYTAFTRAAERLYLVNFEKRQKSV